MLHWHGNCRTMSQDTIAIARSLFTICVYINNSLAFTLLYLKYSRSVHILTRTSLPWFEDIFLLNVIMMM